MLCIIYRNIPIHSFYDIPFNSRPYLLYLLPTSSVCTPRSAPWPRASSPPYSNDAQFWLVKAVK